MISPQIDPQSRTGIVYVDLQPAAAVRAGLFARGELLLDQHTVLTLPETAVLLRDGFSYVFRIEGDKVRQQKVTLGVRRGDRVEIREGLAADTAVVESGVGFLADGVMVRVVASNPNTSPQATTRSGGRP
ncbi:multidrug efflux system subunit MdtA [compost metagenome]